MIELAAFMCSGNVLPMTPVDLLTKFAVAGVRVILLITLLFVAVSPAVPANALDVKVGYLGTTAKVTTISLLEMPAPNAGLAGAQLAIDDNNTTGKFLDQSFALEEILLNGEEDVAGAVQKLSNTGILIDRDGSARGSPP